LRRSLGGGVVAICQLRLLTTISSPFFCTWDYLRLSDTQCLDLDLTPCASYVITHVSLGMRVLIKRPPADAEFPRQNRLLSSRSHPLAEVFCLFSRQRGLAATVYNQPARAMPVSRGIGVAYSSTRGGSDEAQNCAVGIRGDHYWALCRNLKRPVFLLAVAIRGPETAASI
jgi:hypothetical protein